MEASSAGMWSNLLSQQAEHNRAVVCFALCGGEIQSNRAQDSIQDENKPENYVYPAELAL
jgi:hypothetical protein